MSTTEAAAPPPYRGPPRFMDADAPSVTYKASCHCGLIRFAVLGPQLSTTERPTLHQANSCNCTLCAKNGWNLVYPPRSQLTFEDGCEEKMTAYTREGGRVPSKFCPRCGTCVLLDIMGKLGDGDNDILCVNVNTFDEVDIHKLDVKKS